MTPERLANALEEFIRATAADDSSGPALARQRIAKQTFVNELRLLIQVIMGPSKGARSNERLDELRTYAQDEATYRARGRAARRRAGG